MNFSQLVYVLRLTIGVWGAQETDRETSDEILDAKLASRKAGKFVKNVLGGECKQLKDIQKFAASFRLKIKYLTSPHGTGSYIFPVGQVETLLGIVYKANQEFDELVQKFVDAYPSIIEDAKQKSGNLLREDQFPPISAVRRKFTFEYNIEPLPDATSFDSAVDVLRNDLVNQYEQRLENVFEQSENILAFRLASRVKQCYESFSNYVGKQGQLRQDTLENCLTEIDVVLNLNVRNKPELISWCDKFSLILQNSAKFYRENLFERNEAIRELGTILREMGIDTDDTSPDGTSNDVADVPDTTNDAEDIEDSQVVDISLDDLSSHNSHAVAEVDVDQHSIDDAFAGLI